MNKRFLCKLKQNEEIIIENGSVFIKKKFDKHAWAMKIIADHWSYGRYDCYDNSLARTVIVFDTTDKTKKTGVAICHNTDKYDFIVGKAIALCRLKGLRIPKEIFE